jgi:hypothetical protein
VAENGSESVAGELVEVGRHRGRGCQFDELEDRARRLAKDVTGGRDVAGVRQ